MNNLVKIIEKKRIVSGLSKAELCRQLDINTVYYWRLVTGEASPNVDILAKMGEIYGLKLVFFDASLWVD